MAQTLQRTPVHDRHVGLGARMVPFAGWQMPVQYEGVIQEHRADANDRPAARALSKTKPRREPGLRTGSLGLWANLSPERALRNPF